MRRVSALFTCLALLTPGVAWAAEGGPESVPVSTVVIAAVSVAVSLLLALLTWSLRNNVDGFKIAMQQSLAEAQKAKDHADACMAELSKVRIEMAGAVTRDDVKALTLAIEQMRQNVAALTTQVAVISHSHQKEST